MNKKNQIRENVRKTKDRFFLHEYTAKYHEDIGFFYESYTCM